MLILNQIKVYNCLRFFKSTTYALVTVAQGLSEIVTLTMATMMIAGFATFCYSALICQVQKCDKPHAVVFRDFDPLTSVHSSLYRSKTVDRAINRIIEP